MVRSPAVVVVGLTGGIGSGKSTVSRLLAERGAIVVDADAIVRELQEPGGPAYDAIVERFGAAVVAPDGTLDRAALASIVFADAEARADLQGLTWPLVGRVMAKRIAAHAGSDAVVVLDVPLLAERGRDAYRVAGVIVVDSPEEVAMARLVEQRGFSATDVRARAAAQMSREDRLAVADIVVDNSGSLSHLEAQLDEVWAWIERLRTDPAAVESQE